MQVAMIGLGKMGANMATRLLRAGHEVFVYDLNEEAVEKIAAVGGRPLHSLDGISAAMTPPRAAWVMVPAGRPTEETVTTLANYLEAEDIIVDGGNSNYKDTMRRAEVVGQRGVHLVDVGTSGGVWGLEEGYSMMVGGPEEAVDQLTPVLKSLAPAADKGWGHVGPVGAGHFVKMIHNGIEYGLMQAYAEGFEIMREKEAFGLDLHQIAEIWRFGSVVRSWLLDLIANALEDDQALSAVAPWVADSGEGRWTVFEAIDLDVPAPVITLALQARLVSRDEDAYAARLLAALRNQFGGHAIKKADQSGR